MKIYKNDLERYLKYTYKLRELFDLEGDTIFQNSYQTARKNFIHPTVTKINTISSYSELLAIFIAELENELTIINQNSKCKITNKTREKAIAKIIKNAGKKIFREDFKGAGLYKNKYLIVSDGVCLIRLKDIIPTPIPLVSDEDCSNVLNSLNAILDNGSQNQGEILSLPTHTYLKQYIKLEKLQHSNTKDKITYDFGENKPMVDVEYLLSMIEILQCNTARISKYKPQTSVLYFSTEVGEGVLCPLKKDKSHN